MDEHDVLFEDEDGNEVMCGHDDSVVCSDCIFDATDLILVASAELTALNDDPTVGRERGTMPTTTHDERRAAAAEYAAKPAASMFPAAPARMGQGLCTLCEGDATSFTDDLSLREWHISGLCQSCQDATFGGDD